MRNTTARADFQAVTTARFTTRFNCLALKEAALKKLHRRCKTNVVIRSSCTFVAVVLLFMWFTKIDVALNKINFDCIKLLQYHKKHKNESPAETRFSFLQWTFFSMPFMRIEEFYAVEVYFIQGFIEMDYHQELIHFDVLSKRPVKVFNFICSSQVV